MLEFVSRDHYSNLRPEVALTLDLSDPESYWDSDITVTDAPKRWGRSHHETVLGSKRGVLWFSHPSQLSLEAAIDLMSRVDNSPMNVRLALHILITIRGRIAGLSEALLSHANAMAADIPLPDAVFDPNPPSRSASDIQALVETRMSPMMFLQGVFSIPILNPIDMARVVLEFGRYIWSSVWTDQFRPVLNRISRGAVDPLGDCDPLTPFLTMAAAIGLLYWKRSIIEIAGVSLEVPLESMYLKGAWLTTGGMLSEHIPSEAVRALLSDHVFPDFQSITVNGPKGACPDPALLRGLAAGLVRETRSRTVYAPQGLFQLLIPRELGYRDYGIKSLKVFVTQNGLFYRHVGEHVFGPILAWRPEVEGSEAADLEDIELIAWSQVVCAALWHDLHVAGEASIRRATGHRRRRQGALSGSTLPPAPAPLPAITLPRECVTVIFDGQREWGTGEEREHAARRMHGVVGHLRRLAADWKRSISAEDSARAFGIVLPDGFTFVRPFIRGGDDVLNPDDVRPTLVRSRGLVSLIALGLTSTGIPPL